MGRSKQVIADAEPLEKFNETRMIMRIDCMWSLTSLVSLDGNGSA